MQLIAEAYHLLKEMLGLDYPAMHRVFADWNMGKLNSYLIEITAQILAFNDQDGAPLLEKILDTAEQKGTGRWTITTALELEAPFTLGAEAVMARDLSVLKAARQEAAQSLTGPQTTLQGNPEEAIQYIQAALYGAKIISYTQGYMMMRNAAQAYGWTLNYGGIATMWRGGCIIRSIFLGRIKEAFDKDPALTNLLLDEYFRDEVNAVQSGWRWAIAAAATHGLPTPAMSSALAFYDGFRRGVLPANLIQAQRDYFGAHTYERIDRPRGEYFHTNWTGVGGDVTAGVYTG
jgi:6-phosphogluconate dehydrogenase